MRCTPTLVAQRFTAWRTVGSLRSETFGLAWFLVLGLVFAISTVSSVASAAGWGTVKGKFVYQGAPPKPQKIVPQQDAQFCGPKNNVVEELVVGENGELANVLVYIRVPRGKQLAVHADYEANAGAKIPLDNQDCRFAGHITLLRVGQTLVVGNPDPIPHNTNIDLLGFNQILPAGGKLELGPDKISKAFRLPSQISCNIHPWMKAWLMVREDPYMAVSNEKGEFEIKNIPAGEHEFQLWQEKSGYVGNVEGKGAKFNKRGRADIQVEDGGVVDLGEIQVPAALFKK